ncbi:MAG TPA: 4-hydroxy-tetrahydrodipicolinate reductase [Nocardioidaceae bacterium]|nr:4-hydroxy-tetrahydrodipicolinate reductase [Nocardioidaceae bacterium]
MIKVGVLGASGRMGSEAGAAIEAADDLELVARIGSGDSRDALAIADVAVDLTRPDAVMDNVEWCVAHGVNVVVGTSGVTSQRLDAIASWLRDGDAGVGVIVVPNFSIGAVLMMRFAAEAARFFESAEIVELHHPSKADAPSGTARRTAELIASARAQAGLGTMPDATSDQLDGARGADVDGVRVHSVRLRGLVAHQEVLLGAAGERLTLRHDSLDRASFMPGVLTAIRYVRDHPGLTIGLDDALGLA